MTDEQIRHMAERFLGWTIPQPFRPDAGISFAPDYNVGTDHHGTHKPTGTNLFGYEDAVAMVRHMAEGMPK